MWSSTHTCSHQLSTVAHEGDKDSGQFLACRLPTNPPITNFPNHPVLIKNWKGIATATEGGPWGQGTGSILPNFYRHRELERHKVTGGARGLTWRSASLQFPLWVASGGHMPVVEQACSGKRKRSVGVRPGSPTRQPSPVWQLHERPSYLTSAFALKATMCFLLR